MRQVQLHEAAEHFAELIAGAEAGESHTIVRNGRPVAQLIPFPKAQISEEARQKAIANAKAIMHHGYDLGGVKIISRDELYDRA